MGFFDLLFGQSKQETIQIQSVMVQTDVDKILRGHLPSVNSGDLYLQNGEVCHYADHARMMNEKIVKEYITKHSSYSVPGFFKGDRWGSGTSRRIEVGQHIEQEFFDGVLYVTNRRTIFLHKKQGFDRRHSSITAIHPFSNALEIQYGSKYYCLFVPDGYLLNDLFELLH